MARISVAVLLVACGASADPRVFDRSCDVPSRRSDRGGIACSRADAGAPFSFALGVAQNGTAACTGTDLVASYNGASVPVTVARSTAAWCTKGNETKDIANGDMVLIPANKPRWMPGGEGDGGNGVAVWASRQNTLLFSQQFDNAAWTKSGSPTVTANACMAPDGTMTADEVDCSSFCYLEQHVCPVDYVFRGAYLRLLSLDGGVNTDSTNFFIGANFTTVTPVTSASWTRMIHDDQADNAIYFGVYYYNGGNPLPAQKFCLWQADCQRNTAQATHPRPPPITTVGSAVTTANEVVTVPNYTPTWSNMRWAATFQPENSPIGSVPMTTGNRIDGVSIRSAARLTCQNVIGGVADAVVGAVDLAVNTQAAFACTYDGVSRLEACTNGTCVDAGSDIPPRSSVTTIGSEHNGVVQANFANGVVKEISLTSSATRDIYLIGDSIVEGNTAGAGNQPQFIIHNQMGNQVAVSNNGVSGYTIEQCNSAWSSTLASVVTAGLAGRTYMMVQCGTNSNSGPTPDDGGTALANATYYLQSMLAAGKDAGVHVLWSTITPTTLTCASFDVPVNAAMTTWANANGVPIANTFAALKDPTLCQLAAAYDVGDALHLNAAGTNVETQTWIQAGRWTP